MMTGEAKHRPRARKGQSPAAYTAKLTAEEMRAIRRGETILDRAIAVARAVETHSLSRRQIATQCRMNPGMITRLAGIGRVVAALPAYRLTRLRQHPAMTWKALQRVPTRGRADTEILAELEAIVARGVVDRRKAKQGRRAARRTAPDAMLTTLAWLDDPAATGDDPMTLVRAYRVHLRAVHDRVGQRLRDIVARSQAAGAGISFVGQSLRTIVEAARTARRSPLSAEAAEAMRLYAEIEAGLGQIARRH